MKSSFTPDPEWRESVVYELLADDKGKTARLVRELRRHCPAAALMVVRYDCGQLALFLEEQKEVVQLIAGAVSECECCEDDESPYVDWHGFVWRGFPLELIELPRASVCMGADMEAIKSFVHESGSVMETSSVPRVRRYHRTWLDSADLEAELVGVGWADVVLPARTLVEVRHSVEEFFNNREIFAALNCPWRRGILIIGPPGTGKTMLCKAIGSSEPELPYIYVTGLKREHGENSKDEISLIFSAARESAPCVIVFEHCESLLDEIDRVGFHEEMSRFEDNDGLFVAATASDLAGVESVLPDWPNYFESWFQIGLPGTDERIEGCRRMLHRLATATGLIGVEEVISIASIVAFHRKNLSLADLKQAITSAALELKNAQEPKRNFRFILEDQIREVEHREVSQG